MSNPETRAFARNQLPKRKSLRIEHYSYKSDGYYFVTICTADKRPLINQYRKIVESFLLSLPIRFTPLESPAIYGEDSTDRISIPYRKGRVKAPSFLTGFTGLALDYYTLMDDHIHLILSFEGVRTSLGEIIRTFKALVKHESGVKEFWQRNYYEHVIRNEKALNKIREYIQNNPMVERIRFGEFYK